MNERVVKMSYKHTIIYKPVCGNCGAVIHGEVSVYGGNLNRYSWSKLSPCACPYCGEYFETVVVPNPSGTNWSIDMDIDFEIKRGST